MASAIGGMVLSLGNACSTSAISFRKNNKRTQTPKVGVVKCVAASSAGLTDHFRTLRLQIGASEVEVKKAFRQLALKYHPDVCKGSNCGVQFSKINEAYDFVMRSFKEPVEEEITNSTTQEWVDDDEMRSIYDSDWDPWEEWMGFEGACTTDYSSHINPYV